jgi:MFS family permease
MAESKQHPVDQRFAEDEDDLSSHRHRMIIGLLGFALPPLACFIAWLLPVDRTLPVPMHSLSDYYYSSAVAIFSGVLAALAVYFFTYDGYDNQDHQKDRIAAVVAAVAALGVALFPTAAPLPRLALPWWQEWMGALHLASAVVLFGAFIFFAAILFPKTSPDKSDQPLPSDKRARNVVYRLCAGIMGLCVALAVVRVLSKTSEIFWPESIALWAFAISWMVKGRAGLRAKPPLRQRAASRKNRNSVPGFSADGGSTECEMAPELVSTPPSPAGDAEPPGPRKGAGTNLGHEVLRPGQRAPQ